MDLRPQTVLKKAGVAMCLSLAFFGLVFFTLVYVNDARVIFPELAPAKVERYGLAKSVFKSNLLYSVSGKRKDRKSLLKKFRREYPQTLITNSARFINRDQVYLAVGSYPLKLEGKDAFPVPAGKVLRVSPKMSGEFLVSTSFVGFGSEPAVEMLINDKPVATAALTPVSQPLDRESFFYKVLGRYLFVNSTDKGGSWEVIEQKASLQNGDEVRFACKNKSGGCFISDVVFYPKEAAPPTQPNVVFILVDTLRADAVNAESAPYMNQLKQSSVSFENAIAPGNMTSPSTNSILACRMPSHIDPVSFSYSLKKKSREEYYAKSQPSFPSAFAKAGYKTAMLGTVAILSEVMEAGVSHGFDEDVAVESEAYETPHLAREARDWVAKNHDKPFFLYLHFNAPHGPYKPPLKDLAAMFPGFFPAFSSWSAITTWQYRGEAHFTDRYVAKVMEAFKKYNLDDNTIFVLSADHGDHFTPSTFANNSLGPTHFGSFFDHGATLLNDEIRVPLIIKEPAGTSSSVHSFVSTIDIGPTLLNMAGLKDNKWCDGRSLAPLWQSPDTKPDAVIGSEGFRERSIIFNQRYKYIRAYAATEKRFFEPDDYWGEKTLIYIEERLHDLQSDPQEAHNLAPLNRPLLHQARQLFRNFYEVKTRTELVIESPKPGPFTVVIDGEVKVEPQATLLIKPTDHGVEIHGSLMTRQVVSLETKQIKSIEVAIAAQPAPLTYTSYRLPLSFDEWRKTATEMHGSVFLDFNKPNAYLRKVEDDAVKTRKIVANQPEFEKILREWGYLHDD
jgi:arylsulfatase A-like enzyme